MGTLTYDDLITRPEWGARYPDGFGDTPLPASELWLHHSATIAPDLLPPYDDDDAAVRTLERIGQQRFGGGISYPWAVTPVGRVYMGLTPARRGAHTRGHNTVGRAIVLVGDYSETPPTRAQVTAVAGLIRLGHDRGWWNLLRLTGGHRDVGPTECPGDAAYAHLADINHAVTTGVTPPAHVPPKTSASPNLLPYAFPLKAGQWFGPPSSDPRNHSGYYSAWDRQRIVLVQQALRRRGWNITTDGRYGMATARIVGAFQREKRLAVDGLVGAVTWAAIDNLPVTA